jgi:hypothetical protein
MTTTKETTELEEQIGQWRNYLLRRQAIHAVDVAELEDHLREQLAGLVEAGLAADEAFLVAVKRMGSLDSLSREFAQEHSERLWKQLVMVGTDQGVPQHGIQKDTIVAFSFAAAAAVAIKLPSLLGLQSGDAAQWFYLRNVSFFVLPFLALYFAMKRRLSVRTVAWLAGAFIVAAVFANIHPFAEESHTRILLGLHLPIALWLAVGCAYAGKRWAEVGGRMDFIRFSGELFIYYVLIALGGGVLTAFTAMVFGAIGIDMEPFFESWLLPCGAMAGLVVASWLVEAKQSVVENMAPVLTRLFTPLFAAMLLAFLVAMVWTGRGVQIEREVLIAFDLLLVVVLGLLLYSISARDPQAVPGAFDVAQVVLVLSALLADALALWAIAVRITEFGASPNRVAALGVNIILLVNLGWSAVLYVGFLRGRSSFGRLERWQTSYLPVYAIWAALVVIVFPPLFGFL